METCRLDPAEPKPSENASHGPDVSPEPEEPPSPHHPFPFLNAPPAYEPPSIEEFLAKHFPGASLRNWHDWHWQLRHRITSLEAASRILELSAAEARAIGLARAKLPLAVTPYYARLLDPHNPDQALRRMVMPSCWEAVRAPGEADDPLGEDSDSPTPGLVHRYPNRVLFLATDFCSTYCRYCTRSRAVGGREAVCASNRAENLRKRWQKCLDYIAATPQIQDVLLSGGDPLTMPEEPLNWLLTQVRAIRHVEFVRIGSKVPAVLPQRITPTLTRMLKKHHPLWVSLHFAHPDELTEESRLACERLADAGIPLGSQTVLLSGVNDDPAILGRLFQGLLAFRVRPYYLYQCDPITGSAHFRTPVSRGVEILRALRGRLSGYAMPTFVIDAPGGGGKVPLSPDYVLGYEGDKLLLRNYAGRTYVYPDSAGAKTCPVVRTGGPA